MKIRKFMRPLFISVILISGCISVFAQSPKENPELDAKVKAFLSSRDRQWYDMNVPTADAQTLYDLIIKNNYKSALEIGTSTGHSGIYIAWALSKTGGKLITIDIDEGRRSQALKNFKEAGLADYIDSRLADAHQLVKDLKGPWDFVFSDADKEWYTNYFNDVTPKLKVGGCYVTHNVSDRSAYGGRGGRGGQNSGYVEYIKSLPNFETTMNMNGGGMSISYKKSEK